MGFDSGGNYTRQRNFSADASAGIKILASAMDQEIDDFASAMEIALLKDGRNAATANIPLGGNRLINVGAAQSVSDFIRAREVIENVPIYMSDTTTSTDTVSVSAQFFTSVSANQAPADGTKIMVRMAATKASAPVLRFSGFSANIYDQDGTSLANNALTSGGIYEFIFNSADSIWESTTHRKAPFYKRTAAEVTAGITPSDYQYEPGNVLRYGATGDGSTDDTTAFANAISTTHDIIVPAGTYLVHDLDLATDHQRITGEDGAILKLANAGTGNDIIDLTGDRCIAENLIFDGNDGTVSSAAGRGITLTGAGCVAKHCKAQDTDNSSGGGHGFGVFGTDCLVEDCEALRCGYAGFKTFNGAHRATFRKIRSVDHDIKGFVHNGNSDLVTIEDAYFQSDVSSIDENLLLDAGTGFLLKRAVLRNVICADNPNNDTSGNGAKIALCSIVEMENCRFEQTSTVAATFRFQEMDNARIYINNCFFAKDINIDASTSAIDEMVVRDTMIGEKGTSGSTASIDGCDAERLILDNVTFADYTTIAVDLEGVDQHVTCIDCVFDRDTTGNCFQWSGSGTPTTAGALTVVGETIVSGGGLTASSANDRIIAHDLSRQIFESASIPTSLTFTIGDFVRNTSPSIDGNNMVLTGWLRLTTGSNHSAGTDWALQYVSTATPAN